MIKAIIFDWGGVLAPSDNKIAAVRLSKNFKFNKNKFYEYFEKHEDDYCHTNKYKEFYAKASKLFKIPVKSIMNSMSADPPDEVFELAKKLSKKYKIYILSNQLKFRTDYIRKNFDLSFFTKTFFSNEVRMKKPDENIFRFVLKKIKLEGKECLFVDDHMFNIKVAKKLGYKTIHFKSLGQFKDELKNF